MTPELNPPTTQTEALRLLDTIYANVSQQDTVTRTAYVRLKELIRLLLPE